MKMNVMFGYQKSVISLTNKSNNNHTFLTPLNFLYMKK